MGLVGWEGFVGCPMPNLDSKNQMQVHLKGFRSILGLRTEEVTTWMKVGRQKSNPGLWRTRLRTHSLLE